MPDMRQANAKPNFKYISEASINIPSQVIMGDFPLDKLLKIPFFVQAPMSRSISIQIRNSNEQTVR